VFKLDGEVSAEVWWYDGPGAGGVKVFIDDTLLTHLAPTETNNGRRTRLMLPSSGRELKLVAQSKGTVLYGVVLEKEMPGIVLDMLGVPSADASLFLTADEELFEDQLKARKPALTMLMFGGNETKRIGWGRSTRERVASDLRKLIGRVKETTRTDCWVVGPLDAVTSKPDAGAYAQRKELLEVIELEREIALDEGCAWFDLYAAMGGAGSIKRFDQAGFMHPDLVHPKGKGLHLLGQLLADALFNAYRNSQANEPGTATSGR
jgi:lysophospholipase L1-like esterase